MKIKTIYRHFLSGLLVALFALATVVSASTITTINGTDTLSSSRTVINTNFSNLNTDKLETTNIDTSAELRSIVTDETGTGGGLVFATSPTLTTPTISGLLSLTQASSSLFSVLSSLFVGATGTTTIVGDLGTSTFSGSATLSKNVNLSSGGRFLINDALVLSGTTLGSGVLTSSLTTVGILDSGSITSNFGSINIGSDSFTGGTATLTYASTTGVSASSSSWFATAGGGVGISTTTSSNLLSIGNAIASGGFYITGVGLGIGSTSPGNALAVQSGANYFLLNVTGTSTLSQTISVLDICSTSGSVKCLSSSSSGGSGTVNSGTGSRLAYYAGTGTAVSETNSNLSYDGAKLSVSFASSTAITVSGTGYFGTASTTNLTVSALTSTRIPYITTGGSFTDSSLLTFDGTRLNATYASSTAITTTGSAYLATTGGNAAVGTTSPSQKLSVQGGALLSGDLLVAGITATSTVDLTAATTKLQGQDKSLVLASTTLSYLGSYGASGSTTPQVWNPSRAIIITGIYCKSDTGNNMLLIGSGLATSSAPIFCNKAGQGLTSESISVAARGNVFLQIGTASGTVPNLTTATFTFKNND